MANLVQRQGWNSGIWMRGSVTLILTMGFVATASQSARAQACAGQRISRSSGDKRAYREHASIKVLHSFTNGADGGSPYAPLVWNSTGKNLYGTTLNGGAGYGVVFRINTSEKETALYSFKGGTDGASPWAGLVRGSKDNLYGTTPNGGAYGQGTVFVVTPAGKEKVLYNFTGGADGSGPVGGLFRASNGDLYGTAAGGGAHGYGTVYRLTPTGAETTLYGFTGGADGAYPYAGLVGDSHGNLYGTTYLGGDFGEGTVFVVASSGERVLYSFAGSPDGARPEAILLRGKKGDLYGTTFGGGESGCQPFGCGTVFLVSPNGTEKVIYSFTGAADGANPYASLVPDGEGHLYGTTFGGGSFASGTVFEVTSLKKETALYSFTGGADGGSPFAGLIWDTQGNLYGTTIGGGAYGYGTVFKLVP